MQVGTGVEPTRQARMAGDNRQAAVGRIALVAAHFGPPPLNPRAPPPTTTSTPHIPTPNPPPLILPPNAVSSRAAIAPTRRPEMTAVRVFR